jgi:hypothetical protein
VKTTCILSFVFLAIHGGFIPCPSPPLHETLMGGGGQDIYNKRVSIY